MNKKIIIGNFKMNLLPNEVVLYIENLKKDIKSNNEIVLCVPYVDIPYINNNLKNTNIHIGAQNVYFEDNGAYTGEISSKMLKSIGVEYILIGHPERRHIFKENDLIINKKLIKCLNYNLKIILCVEYIVQLKKDLKNVNSDQLKNIIFIYETRKSIGKKEIINSKKINNNINKYKKYLLKKYETLSKKDIKIGYGGSINSNNIIELKNIDILLIGSACLDINEFINIINNV